MVKAFGWRSHQRSKSFSERINTNGFREEEFARTYSKAEFRQPAARRKGSQPPEEYIPDSLTVIGHWKTDKLWM